ncbi:MAG TPA: DUF1800 domain-containing protein [Chitinophagaceae bacterium]|nr:DUF1800 domain-containing protein [Chitinophagaceae bacterium]
MKIPVKLLFIITAFIAASFSSFRENSGPVFPWGKAGLTEQEAAAHLLSRFTYGARPGEIETVIKMGLEKWFGQQLEGNLPDESLNQLLDNYTALKLTNAEVVSTYPRGAQVLRMAVKDGVINKDSINREDKKAYRDKLKAYLQQNGMRPQQELFRQFINQKILRAAYGNNQLQEVMTDFWFNHFNVSITKNDCAQFIPSYERDVIRPNALGRFETLLLATAKSPAMLLYLDNFSSAGNNTNDTEAARKRRDKFISRQLGDSAVEKIQKARKAQGLNENYAREVMELHTLGVDGGYTQQDVTEAARALTGWTIYPFADNGPGSAMRKLIGRLGEDRLEKRGFVHEGDFLFAINRHDQGEKTVMGKRFPANGGYEEGVKLLTMLAHHSSAAMFISRKLAVRFVSDNPPQSLVDKMAATFTEKKGDIKQVLLTMVSSPEFWSREALGGKTKSPFELAISAVRSLDASINQPYQLYDRISKMGQNIYHYQAPTGFPDNALFWINSGSLLERMNFGLALAENKIPGIRISRSEDAKAVSAKLGSPEFQKR